MTSTTMLPPPPSGLRTLAPPRPKAGSQFRPDIEGLRAIAVLAVLAFHASVPGLGGGFVGVDIFFVISGFLITGQLAREAERSGTVRLGAFYARRAKRIIPPAAVVLAATAVGSFYFLPKLTAYRSSFDLGSALLYFANWRFIGQGKDYLGATQGDSVVLHFWSLAVEEQFYLVWPLLVLIAAWLAFRSGRSTRTTVAIVLSIATVASFAASIRLTSTDPALAYMATYTRAWQFGVGGLLALAIVPTSRVRGERAGARYILPFVRICASVLGAGLIAYALVAINNVTPYPGTAALFPTLGAAALILAGPKSATGWILSTRPMRLIGRVSYSWYLWHWPVLILAEAKWGHLVWTDKVLLTLGSGLLAAVTYALVEKPAKFLGRLRHELMASSMLGLGASVVALAVILMVGTSIDRDLNAPVVAAAAPVTTFQPGAKGLAAVFGPDTGQNSGGVSPSALAAASDVPLHGECIVDRTSVQPPCALGVKGGRSVVLFGDSHAHQWEPAMVTIAKQHKWALTEISQSGCPVPDIAPRAGSKDRYSQSFCSDWRRQQTQRIVAMKPAVVFVSTFDNYIPQQDELKADWFKSIEQLQRSGAKIVYLRDTPYPGKDIPACVSSSLDDWSKCAFNVPARPDVVVQSVTSGELTGVTVIDMDSYLCKGAKCPAVVNGTLIYRDESHLSATAVNLLAPALANRFKAAGLL
jgi:peptidoglycan/LPS O-acetylase OafA/YrhL